MREGEIEGEGRRREGESVNVELLYLLERNREWNQPTG